MPIKKILILGIIFLFLGTCITPSVALDNVRNASFPIYDKTVIIVDDEGDGDYTSIEEAVNNTSPGDIIEVYSGTYFEENIIIETPRVTIKGVSYEFLNGTDSGAPLVIRISNKRVFFICSEEVIMTNLRIEYEQENMSQSWYPHIHLFQAKKSIITDNEIRYCMVGIKSTDSDDAKIINNTLEETEVAIWLDSESNEVSENRITYSKYGIYLNRAYSSKIIRNWVTQCHTSIMVSDSNHNYICCNNLEKNLRAIRLLDSKNNTIQQNNIMNNSDTVYLSHSNSNYICCNNIVKNSREMVLMYSENNIIQQNNFINNSDTVYFFNTKNIITQRWSTIFNKWKANYWDNWTGIGPKMLIGRLILIIGDPYHGYHYSQIAEITFLQFDWRPAVKPYDI